jgi:hypothetical protein
MAKIQGSWICTINVLDSAGLPAVLYFSDDGYKDTKGIYYQPRMKQPARITIAVNDGGLLPNVSGQSSIGEIELDNTDGRLNYLADYYLDGRDCTLQLVSIDGTVTTWFKGIVTRINQRGTSIYLTLKTFSESLDLPLNQARYNGSGGVEGLPTDVMGNVKPRIYGNVLNASPVLCYASLGIYQVSDLATCSVSTVYHKGLALTLGVTRPSLAALLANTPTADTYDRFQGYFRLGTMDVQEITVDASDDVNKAGDVFDKICQSISFSSGMRTIAEIPALLDAPTNKYQVSGSTSTVIQNVYNSGVLFDSGTIAADLSTFNSTTPLAGTCVSYQNLVKITPRNSTEYPFEPIPIVAITCDYIDSAVDYTSSKTITVNSTAITNLNAVSTGGLGLYINQETTFRSALDSVVKSVGGYWWFGDSIDNSAFIMNADIYSEPDDIADFTVQPYQIQSAERTATGVAENGIPFYSIVGKYGKIETVQKDVLGATTQARRSRVAQHYLVYESFDGVVKQKHPQAQRLEIETLLSTSSDTTAVTDRLLNYFKKRCDIVSVNAYFSNLPEIKIGQTVLVKYDKLWYNDGVKFRLIGYEMDIKRKSVTMKLMGYKV